MPGTTSTADHLKGKSAPHQISIEYPRNCSLGRRHHTISCRPISTNDSTAANGEAVTYVVIEYQWPFPSQVTPFMAEITIPPQNIQTILYQHFQAYHVHKIEPKKDQEEGPEKPDEVMLKEQQAKSKTADDTSKALFANRDEFLNAQATEEFFKDATSVKDSIILNFFCSGPQRLFVEAVLRMGLYAERLMSLVSSWTKPSTGSRLARL